MSRLSAPPLIVLGSINRDHSVTVDHHPKPGETVLGGSYAHGTGGKGANQAVAAARAGVTPVLVAVVGRDSAGEELLADLRQRGIDISHVTRHADLPSGTALITVSRDGENAIVVAPGAGSAVDPSSTARTVATLAVPGSVFLSQLELPLPAIVASSIAAHEAGARVVLNLSPFRPVPDSLLRMLDPLVVNAGEAGDLAADHIETLVDAERVARQLASRCHSVVITLGDKGALVAEGDTFRRFPAREVRVVDTTGAGDSFAGALAAALVRGEPLDQAVQRGIDASAITVQHRGAQPPS